MVASAPGARCGIARYASQHAERLRGEGHTVHWASVDGGTEGVEHAFRAREWGDFTRLLALCLRYERVVVHAQHDFFHPPGLHPDAQAAKNLAWTALYRAHRGVEVVAHELDVGLLVKGGVGRKIRTTERLKWRAAPHIVLHTERERAGLLAELPEVAARVELREHHRDMRRAREVTREGAREELGVPPDARALLCIGFLQESKGFDRAVRALREVADPRARLYVVGSVREPSPGTLAHVEGLRALAAADARVRLVEGFVDDAAFDTWLAAADAVVLPYRAAFSSGVAARARLWGRRLVASRVGGLEDQLSDGDLLFETDAELAKALAAACEDPAPSATPDASVRKGARRVVRGLRLAFVTPWYGADIPGGAEAQARKTVERLAERGVEVEVLTTTVRDFFSDWSVNARRAGLERVNGVPVRRFPVLPRDAAAFSRANEKVRARQALSPGERRVFEEQMLRAPSLVRHVAESRGAHDLFVFIPYMFQTTLEGSRACPGQAVHIPCLHEEGYLDLDCYADMLRAARGVLFNAPAERDLALRRFGLTPGQYAMAGEGVVTDWAGDGEAFRARHGLGDYLLFVGRKDADKNFPLLLEHFRRYREERAPDLALVVAGPGERHTHPRDAGAVLDLGFAAEGEKRDALAGSLALCQPSLLESFSLTCMESWVAGRPVLVHADCAVTREHCLTGGGGLFFRTYPEFAACLDLLRRDRALADRLGAAGRRYVQENFAWPRVLDRYLEALEGWAAAARLRPAG